MELALETLRNHDLIRLLSNRKLRLVLDLDHTLLHALGISHLTQQERDHLLYAGCRPHQHHYFGEGNLYNIRNLMIKLRPYIKTFLKEASELFELSVYTMGNRHYASIVTPILDPDGSYFGAGGKNVLTREDCTTPGQKGLDVLLSHERATLVVDDTPTVWQLHPRNLIQIAPYRFFADSRRHRSWSEFHKDESEVRGELARMLKVLRKVHRMFYDTREGDCLWNKDVRVVLDEIRKKSPKLFKLSSPPAACEPESDQHGIGSLISMLNNLSLSSESSEVTNQHQPILFGF